MSQNKDSGKLPFSFVPADAAVKNVQSSADERPMVSLSRLCLLCSLRQGSYPRTRQDCCVLFRCPRRAKNHCRTQLTVRTHAASITISIKNENRTVSPPSVCFRYAFLREKQRLFRSRCRHGRTALRPDLLLHDGSHHFRPYHVKDMTVLLF